VPINPEVCTTSRPDPILSPREREYAAANPATMTTLRMKALALEPGLFILALVATLSWAVASIAYPLGSDQGMMGSIGDVIVRGGLPYRDGFDMKGPLAFYLFAGTEALFGRVTWGIRIVDVGILLTGAWFFYDLLRRLLGSEPMSRWLALAMVLAAASRSWFHVSQPDGWAAVLVVVALWLLLGRERVSTTAWISSGLLIGASALLKPVFITLIAVPIAVAATGGIVAAVAPVLLTLSGAVLPIAATAAWFWVNGALDDLIAVHFRFALIYSGASSTDVALLADRFVSYFYFGAPRTPQGPFTVLAVPILAGVVMAWKHRRGVGLPLLVWLTVALGCVVVQQKFFVYHWLIAFPPLLAVAGFGLSKLPLTETPGKVFAAVAIGVFVVRVALTPAVDTLHFIRLVARIDSHESYLARFGRGNYQPLSASQAAAHIKSRTQPDERIAIYGTAAAVLFLSERASATRFVFALPLNVADEGHRNANRAEFMSDLRKLGARYVVVGPDPDQAPLGDFPEFTELLAQHYRLEIRFGGLGLYRLVDRPGEVP
jgi:hypothetical protein